MDDVDPSVKLFVQEALATTRHWMRDEIAALGVKVELSTATATKEHAEVKGALTLLLAANLEPRVKALEDAQVADQAAADAVDKLRRQQRWIAAFVVAATPVALLVAPHIH